MLPKEANDAEEFGLYLVECLGFTAALAALPRVPITQQFQLLVEAGLFHQNVELGAGEALAERFGAVGDAPDGQRGERSVQLQFAHVDFVQRVRRRVVIWQVVGLFLVGDERGHSFKQEIKIVRAERSVIRVGVRAPGFERLQHLTDTGFDIAAPAQRIAGDAADAGVIGDHGADFVEFSAMGLYVFERANRALFFAAEEHESNRAARQEPGGLDRARGFDHQRGIAAVVKRAGAQFPGIEMRAQDDGLIRLFVAADFSDNVFLFDGPTDFVGHVQPYADPCLVSGDGSRQAQPVFTRQYGLRNLVNLPGQGIRVAIKEQPFPSTDPENRRSAFFDGAVNDHRWAKILVEQVRPGRTNITVHQ